MVFGKDQPTQYERKSFAAFKPCPSPRQIWAKAERAAQANKHEAALAAIYDEQGIGYVRGFKALPDRNLLWDFRIGTPLGTPTLLIEVHGQIWRKGGHSTGAGITRDCEKLNLAIVNGFRQLSFTPEMIADGRALLWTLEALGLNG